jgi:hypothetical protein
MAPEPAGTSDNGDDNDNVSPDGGGSNSGPGNRTTENLVLAGFFVVLVAAGVWLLGTMADVRKVQDCAAQGRRNCQTIEVPDRSR